MKSSLRIYAFFLCILIFSVYFVLRPPEREKSIKRTQEEIALIELKDFALYSIKYSKPQLLVIGSKALQFDHREEFFDLFLANYGIGKENHFTQKDIEYFKVGHAIKKKDIYLFSQGIDYLNEEGVGFIAQKGRYDAQNKTFIGEGKFELSNEEGKFWGEDLRYNGITMEAKASFPRGKIWLE